MNAPRLSGGMMNIGMVSDASTNLDSLIYLFGVTADLLRESHHVVYRSSEYVNGDANVRDRINRDFINGIDLIVGPLDAALLQTREDLGCNTTFICWLLGNTGHGLHQYHKSLHLLRHTDIFVGNCIGDITILNRFVTNATSVVIPFPVDIQRFYPLSVPERNKVRESLDIPPDANMILYAGRITIEKNLHTVIRICSSVFAMLPDTHLVIAGPIVDAPFLELSVFSLNLKKTVDRLLKHLCLRPERIHILGPQGRQRLHELYATCDVFLSMTLHHDENFGLAQVEAMACGAPVICTNWGGLRDTVLSGVTGHRINTEMTPVGVKIAWVEAVSRITQLLQDETGKERLREACINHVSARFTIDQYRNALSEVILKATSMRGIQGEALIPTPFAIDFWDTCCRSGLPRYDHKKRSFDLYRQMIVGYVEPQLKTNAILKDSDGRKSKLYLYSPLRMKFPETIEVDDLIYPVRIAVPICLCAAVVEILGRFSREIVLSVDHMISGSQFSEVDMLTALEWMIREGLLCTHRPETGEDGLTMLNPRLNEPLFCVERIDRSGDLIVVE